MSKSYVSGSHAIWENIQVDSFTGWMNQHLQERGLQIKDIVADFSDGVMLINLLEIVSGKKLPRYVRNPKFLQHKIDNVLIALQFMEKQYDLKTVGINSKDIVDGNLKQIMGIVFMLIQKLKANEAAASGNNNNGEESNNNNSGSTTSTSTTPVRDLYKRATIVGTAVSRFAAKSINDGEKGTSTTTQPVNASATTVGLSSVPTGGPSINTIRSRFTSVPPVKDNTPHTSDSNASNTTTTTENINSQTLIRKDVERGVLKKTKSGAIISLSGSIVFNNKESTIDVKKLIICQAYVRGWLVRRKWGSILKQYRERLRSYEQHFKVNPKAYRGLCRVQARIKGRMERKRLWRQYPLFRRNDIIKEIIYTEKRYVHSLEVLIELYLKECEKVLTSQQVKSIFSQVEVIKNVNSNILDQLVNRFEKGRVQLLGEIFKKMTDYLKVYTIYVNNYNTSFQTVTECMQNPKFVAILDRNRTNEKCNGLDLSAFLIAPIQRLPRYVLLLQDLFKHTDQNHPDYENISVALKKMKDVAEYVNEKKREAENLNQVLTIQNNLVGKFNNLAEPHRRFVRKGPLTCVDDKTSKVYFFFLFNDLLVKTENKNLAKMVKDSKSTTMSSSSRSTLVGPIVGADDGKYKFITSYYLDGSSLVDLFDPSSPCTFQLLNVGVSNPLASTSIIGGISLSSEPVNEAPVTTNSSITLTALSHSEKMTWIGDIDESISQLLEKHRSKKRSYIPEHEELTSAPYEGPIKDSEMSGILIKQRSELVWKPKQFYLKNSILYYHAIEENEVITYKPKKMKSINLILCSVKLTQVVDHQHCFQLITPLRIYFFSCPESQTLFLWISLIRSSITKKLDSLHDSDSQSETSDSKSPALESANGSNGSLVCADCGAADPTWASTSLGVVLCVECSAIHRHLPNNVSVVKSIRGLSTSQADLTALMEGHSRASTKYEKNITSSMQRPASKDPYEVKLAWIHAKYVPNGNAPASPGELRKATIKVGSISSPTSPLQLSASLSTNTGMAISLNSSNNQTSLTRKMTDSAINANGNGSVSSSPAIPINQNNNNNTESSTIPPTDLANGDANAPVTTPNGDNKHEAAVESSSTTTPAVESKENGNNVDSQSSTTASPSKPLTMDKVLQMLNENDIGDNISSLPTVPSGSNTWKLGNHHRSTASEKDGGTAGNGGTIGRKTSFLDKPRSTKRTEFEGIMYKSSSPSKSGNWKKYLFEYKDKMLNYYKIGKKTTKKDKPRGTIDLGDFYSLKVEPQPKQQYSFTLITMYRLYFFATDTEEDLKTWIEVLEK